MIDCLFLVALGPTATVLAYDLTKHGAQAIDIGHLDIEYEWFRARKGIRVPVKYKPFQESPIETAEDIIMPKEYYEQIICNLSSLEEKDQ